MQSGLATISPAAGLSRRFSDRAFAMLRAAVRPDEVSIMWVRRKNKGKKRLLWGDRLETNVRRKAAL